MHARRLESGTHFYRTDKKGSTTSWGAWLRTRVWPVVVRPQYGSNGYEWLWRLEREWKRRLLCFRPGRRLIVSEKTEPGSYLPRSLSKKKKIQRLYKMAMSFSQKGNWWPYFPLQTTVMNLTTQVCSFNQASLMTVDEQLVCSFKILKPHNQK